MDLIDFDERRWFAIFNIFTSSYLITFKIIFNTLDIRR